MPTNTKKHRFQVIQGGKTATPEPLTEYQKFEKGILASLAPAGSEETQLATAIAQGFWRLNEIRNLEFRIFAEADGDPDPAAAQVRIFRKHGSYFAKTALYEERLQGLIFRMEDRLRGLQKERLAQRVAARREACTILRQAIREGAVPDAQRSVEQNGFVFSISELLIDITREQLRKPARKPKAT
jgi:hypothetical protein